MKNIIYIASRYPSSYAGREYMIKQNLKFFDEAGYTVDFVYLGAETSIRIDKNVTYYQIKKPSLFEIAFNLIFKTNLSLQERLFYSNFAKNKILDIFVKNKKSVILVDMVRMSSLAEDISCGKILEYDDLLSLRYKRMYDNFSNNIDLLGTYSDKYPSAVVKIIKPFGKYILAKENKLMDKREIYLSKRFSLLSFTSPLEANNFSEKVSSNIVFANPPAIPDFSCNEDSKVSSGGMKFSFVGNLKANHNLATLKNIKDLFSREDVIQSGAEIDVYGDYDQRALELCKNVTNIHLHGMVENIDDAYLSSSCLIAPIPFGSGIKVKVIEAMSYGLLVITNDIGAEGIGLKAGYNYIDYIDDDHCAHSIVSLQNGTYDIGSIASKGTEHVRKNFSETIVKSNLLRNIESL